MSITVRQLIDLLLDEDMNAIVTVGIGEGEVDLKNDLERDWQRHEWIQLQAEDGS